MMVRGCETLRRYNWIHPEAGEDSESFCRRAGIKIGDTILVAEVAGYAPRYEGHGSVRSVLPEGTLDVHAALRVKITGFKTYGGCRMVKTRMGAINLIVPGLYTGNLVSSPVRCWPVAKVRAA